ncbi:hypothetical protein A0H76_492 [Hepatospora eriocheir]|uniref:Uncharacterized protein n=1 Tax=Hepatospora eriocheir TaxID=1081669 RepID=A0A1X0QIM6_9MICR|nr:hypothetical protein A0H76_492 [Hepatospora eriocheir]
MNDSIFKDVLFEQFKFLHTCKLLNLKSYNDTNSLFSLYNSLILISESVNYSFNTYKYSGVPFI